MAWWCRRSASTASRRRTSRSTISSGTWCTWPWERTMSFDDRGDRNRPRSQPGARRAPHPARSASSVPVAVAPSCPVPLVDTDRVLLGHGSGGAMTAELVARHFLPAFRNAYVERLDDQAVLDVGDARLAFTTDSYVVSPLFFPGGDIGALAVNGTVNDLAMAGARPLYLSAGFILEEGFP